MRILNSYLTVHQPDFYSADLIRDLEVLMQFAVDRFPLLRTVEGASKRPELDGFPRLAVLVDHAHELTAFWRAALDEGLCQGTGRDTLAGHAHAFMQEVAEDLMARDRAVPVEARQAAAEAALTLLKGSFRDAFNAHYAHDLGAAAGYLDDEDDAMPGPEDRLTLAQQRRVLLQVLNVCVEHARLHGILC